MLPAGLVIAAITERADPRDVLVVRPEHQGCGGLAGLPAGSVIGTSSVRRCALVQYLYPGKFRVQPVRGNVDTRLRKLDGGGAHGNAGGATGHAYDALILAAAGLRRLGLDHRIEAVLEFPYSAGQGALAVECRADDIGAKRIARSVAHWASTVCCSAERALLRTLLGGCQVPVGVTSSLNRVGGAFVLSLASVVVTPNGRECVEAAGATSLDAPSGGGRVESGAVLRGRRLGEEIAAKLRDAGSSVQLLVGKLTNDSSMHSGSFAKGKREYGYP